MQRREPARVARHDIGALIQEQLHDGKLVRNSGGDKRCCLIAGPAVHICAICQFLLDRSPIANVDGCEQARVGSGQSRRQYCD